jgi:hypothetical protein
VYPTAELSPTHHYSDMATTELFTAHVLLFNQEVAGLWQRYNFMLLANSALFSLFAMREDSTNPEILMTLVLGLTLCTAWALVTWTGSSYQKIWIEAAQRFDWEGDAECRPVNPFTYWHVARQKQKIPLMLNRIVLASVVIIFFVSYITLAYVRFQ